MTTTRRRIQLGLAAAATAAVHWLALAAYAEGQLDGPRLEAQIVSVAPAIVWSGDTVELEALVANRGDAPVHELRLGIAFAGDGQVGREWVLLEQEPSGVVAQLVPGEELRFRARAQLNGNGWTRVGIAGRAADAMLFPQGRPVRVVSAATSVGQAAGAFVLYVAVTGGAVLASRRIFRPIGNAPALAPHPRLMLAGAAVIVLGPAVLWGIRQWLLGRPGGLATMPPAALLWLPLGGVALFAVGWIIAAAGLRPRGRLGRGVALGLLLYVVAGLLWVVGFNLSLGTRAEQLLHPAALIIAVLWPLQVAQVTGLFGLSMD